MDPLSLHILVRWYAWVSISCYRRRTSNPNTVINWRNKKKSIKNILWCNCTPIPDDLPKNEKNSERGPNSIEQILTNDSVINRNKSIVKEMKQLNIELLDIYMKK